MWSTVEVITVTVGNLGMVVLGLLAHGLRTAIDGVKTYYKWCIFSLRTAVLLEHFIWSVRRSDTKKTTFLFLFSSMQLPCDSIYVNKTYKSMPKVNRKGINTGRWHRWHIGLYYWSWFRTTMPVYYLQVVRLIDCPCCSPSRSPYLICPFLKALHALSTFAPLYNLLSFSIIWLLVFQRLCSVSKFSRMRPKCQSQLLDISITSE